MPTAVIMPENVDAITDGRVVQWLKNEDEYIQPTEALCEVKMDGENIFVFSPVEGFLLKVLVSEGERALAGSIIAWVGDEGETWWDQTQPVNLKADEQPQPKRYRGFISPAVARLLQIHPVDLSRVQATGEGGRITRNDLLAYLEEHDFLSGMNHEFDKSSDEEAADIEGLPYGDSAQLELENYFPFGMLLREADLSQVDAHREQSLKNNLKLTYTAYFVSAAMSSLKRFPGCNVSWTPEGVIQYEEIMLGFIIQQDSKGYAIPTFKGLENISLAGISRVLQELSAKARSRSLQPARPKPGTFTILNHGRDGALWSFPIIQSPQAVVLAFGAVTPRPAAINGKVEVRPMVHISLAYDRRAITTYQVDQFLKHVVQALERWNSVST